MNAGRTYGYTPWVALGAAAAVWAYIAVRAWTVPISHDESVTFFLYVQRGAFLPPNMIWDANNHILNSAFMYAVYRLGGSDLFWLRLPNVLAFALYAWYSWRLTSAIKGQATRTLTYIALITPALLVELFAQTRGYGMSMAFVAGALYHLTGYLRRFEVRQLWITWAWLVAGLLANMSLVNTFLISLGVTAVAIAWQVPRKRWPAHGVAWLTGGVVPFALAALYAMAMRERGLLYYGELTGFVEVTIVTLNKYIFFSDHMATALLVALIGVVCTAIVLWRKPREFFQEVDFGVVAGVFLAGNVAGTLALRWLLEVNFPEDRTGLYFVPLFILVVGYAVDRAAQKRQVLGSAGWVLAAVPAMLLLHANIGYTHLWRELHVHPDFYSEVARLSGHDPTHVTVEGYHLTASSWGFAGVRHPIKLSPITHTKRGHGEADFAICHGAVCNEYINDYDTLMRDPHNETYLLQRRNARQWIPIDATNDESLDNYSGAAEYINLMVTRDTAAIPNIKGVDVEVYLSSGALPLLVDLVVAARDADDQTIFYEAMPIDWIRNRWQGDTLSLRRPVVLPSNTKMVVCYLWNIFGVEMHATMGASQWLTQPENKASGASAPNDSEHKL